LDHRDAPGTWARQGLEVMVEPARRCREDGCRVRPGEHRGRVPEVADVQQLLTAELLICPDPLLEPEREIPASLEHGYGRLDLREGALRRARARTRLQRRDARAGQSAA